MSWTIVSPSKKNDGRQQALIYKSAFRDGEPQTIITRNQNVDGSVTPVRFKLSPPVGQTWQISRMVFLIRDDGVFDSGGWGNQSPASPLPNGMTIGLFIGGVEYNQTPIPWTTVADLAGVAYDLSYNAFGQGDNFITVRLTFQKAGQNIRLNGDDGDFIWIDVNDDLTYLTEQRAMFQGFIEGVYL